MSLLKLFFFFLLKCCHFSLHQRHKEQDKTVHSIFVFVCMSSVSLDTPCDTLHLFMCKQRPVVCLCLPFVMYLSFCPFCPRVQMKLMKLLQRLPASVVRRLHRERYRKPSWLTPIPDTHKLTEEDITEFVQSMMQPVLLAMFSKTGSLDAAQALQNLALMRPELVIPPVLEKWVCAVHLNCPGVKWATD